MTRKIVKRSTFFGSAPTISFYWDQEILWKKHSIGRKWQNVTPCWNGVCVSCLWQTFYAGSAVDRAARRPTGSLSCWQSPTFTIKADSYDTCQQMITFCIVLSPGAVACSCNPATWRQVLLDGLRRGVLLVIGSCWSSVRTKACINMDPPGEPGGVRLTKEGRIGPGGKPSSQESPCESVVGRHQWVAGGYQPLQHSQTQNFWNFGPPKYCVLKQRYFIIAYFWTHTELRFTPTLLTRDMTIDGVNISIKIFLPTLHMMFCYKRKYSSKENI